MGKRDVPLGKTATSNSIFDEPIEYFTAYYKEGILVQRFNRRDREDSGIRIQMQNVSLWIFLLLLPDVELSSAFL